MLQRPSQELNLALYLLTLYCGLAVRNLGEFVVPDKFACNAESVAAALAHAAADQGDTASVAALAVSLPTLRVGGEIDWPHR